MPQIKRRDDFLNEPIALLDRHYEIHKGNRKMAWQALGKAEKEFIHTEIATCEEDSRYYLENYHAIRPENGLPQTLTFNEAQEIYWDHLTAQYKLRGKCKLIVCKGRQLGISTVTQGFLFYRTVFTLVCNSLIVAQDPSQADYLFGMSRFAYDFLPWWMRPEERYQAKGRYLVFDKKDAFERQLYPGLQSGIYVEAANKETGIGVGKQFRNFHGSEVSDWGPTAGKILATQVDPTTRGSHDLFAVLESTSRGKGNTWHSLWVDSEEGRTDWDPVFIPPYVLPKYSLPITKEENFERTDEESGIARRIKEEEGMEITDGFFKWRRVVIADVIAQTGDEWMFHQEYCLTAADSFQASGICVFNKRKLQRVQDIDCAKPIWYGEIYLDKKLDRPNFPKPLIKLGVGEKPPLRSKQGGRFWVWEPPKTGDTFYVGGDVAYGIEGGDFSVASVWRVGRGQQPDVQVAEWRGWIAPEAFGHVLAAIGFWYNSAEISCEINDCGKTVNNELFRVIGYPKLYQWKFLDKMTNIYSNFFGWQTNHKSKADLISNLIQVIEGETARFRSEALVDELMSFGSTEGTSKMEGQGMNDDLAISAMIALYCAHEMDWGEPRFSKEEKQRANQGAQYSLAETDYSPIHDKPGPRQNAFRKGEVPAECILYESIHEYENAGDDPDDAWKNY